MRILLILACLAWLALAARAAETKPPAQPPEAASRDEALAIIVHKSNPVATLTPEELRRLCLADRRHWPNGRKVTLVLLEPGRPEREAVLRQICQMGETEFTRHFLQRAFVGEIQAGPKELASPAGARRFVVNVHGAIGFIRFSEVDDTVKVVRLDGLAPDHPEYALKIPAPRAAPASPGAPKRSTP